MLAFLILFVFIFIHALPSSTTPNVILIVMDAARADQFHVQIQKRSLTPYFERWARHGVLYTRAYTIADYTYGSMASLFSGRPEGFHVPVSELPTKLHILRYLRLRGIHTVLFSMSPFIHPKFGFTEHFDDVRTYQTRENLFVVVKDITSWVSRAKKPFFMYIHLFPPHSPYSPPSSYLSFFKRQPDYRAVGLQSPMLLNRVQYTKKQLKTLFRLYQANVRYADHAVGVLLDTLKEKGLLDTTWIIITSDHGEAFGEHGQTAHTVGVYEELIHVPLLVIPPKNKRVRKISTPVYMQQIGPSLLDIYHIRTRDELFFHALPGVGLKHGGRHPYIFSCTSRYRMCALIENTWKAILYRRGEKGYVSLFRLPNEKVYSGNRALVEYERALSFGMRLSFIPAFGHFRERTGKATEEYLEQLRALGYAGLVSESMRILFSTAPLPEAGLHGRVVFSGKRKSTQNGQNKVEYVVRVRNMSLHAWTGTGEEERGVVCVRLTISQFPHGQDKVQSIRCLDHTVLPGKIWEMHFPLTHQDVRVLASRPQSFRFRLDIRQVGETRWILLKEWQIPVMNKKR